MKYLLFTGFLQIGLAIASSAQESNLKEDYSAYLPEVRNFNKMLSQFPQSGTILTKEGLQKAREGMKAYINANTILKPTESARRENSV